MKKTIRWSLGAGALLGLATWLVPVVAGADPLQGSASFHRGPANVVFAQTENPAGNQVVAYDQAPNGTLSLAGTYDTGGLGGMVGGGGSDHLASQGSLTYDALTGDLYAVNAGSNSVSVFSVRGDHLSLQQVVSSGGVFPVSVTAHGPFVYVLNGMDGGSVQGYSSWFGRLIPIPGSNRSLGLTIPGTTTPTEFKYTPGQVAFSPNGSQLIVTTKLNTTDIDVFRVGPFGNLSPSPAVNSEPATGPFALTFDQAGHLVVANVGSGALATYTLNADGTVRLIDSVATHQSATCWVAAAGRFFYTGNAGSSSETGFSATFAGQLTFLGNTPTDPGTITGSATADGRYLYAKTGAKGIVDEFQVNGNGSLTKIGSVTVANAIGGNGIALAEPSIG